MLAIKMNITGFISNDQPGFVECRFCDVWNKEHIIHEKIPVVTLLQLDTDSPYPQEGAIACEIIKEWMNEEGQTILTVNTAHPWGIETIDGLEQFDVFKNQIVKLE